MRLSAAALLIISAFATTALAKDPAATGAKKTDASATYQDIQKTIGMVPQFMKAYPPEGIPYAWEHFKVAELEPGAVPAKYKELTGLAVSAQIPCHYCVYAHIQFAKANGATDAEIKEAVALAATTRAWSTYLTGIQADLPTFKKEVAQMMTNMKSATGGSGSMGGDAQQPPMMMKPVTTADEARADMQKMFGIVPTFAKAMPGPGLVAMWNHTKAFEMGETAIPAKYKALISMGVSANDSCAYCAAFDAENAKANGATQQEMGEALMLAANTRIWSTVLNGNNVDDAQFRRDVDQMVKNAKAAAAKKGTGGSGEQHK